MPRERFSRLLWRVTRQVFHETTGTVFFLLALLWGAAAWRGWHQSAARWVWIGCGSIALTMAIFGFTSFRSARRVR